MRTVLRFLFVIPLGFVAACVFSALALLWPFVRTGGGRLADPVFALQLAGGFLAQVAQVGSAALLPWALFMAATEILGASSILLHVAAGFLGGVALTIGAYGGQAPALSVQTAIVVASLVFALVYWIVAGRSAGRWRRRGRGAPPP